MQVEMLFLFLLFMESQMTWKFSIIQWNNETIPVRWGEYNRHELMKTRGKL